MRHYGIHLKQSQVDKEHSEVQAKHMAELILATEAVAESAGGKPIEMPEGVAKTMVERFVNLRERRGDSPLELEAHRTRLTVKANQSIPPEELVELADEFNDGLTRANAAVALGDEVIEVVKNAHGFTFEGGIPELLLETGAPHPERLPFLSCFLDVDIVVDDRRLLGILVAEANDPQVPQNGTKPFFIEDPLVNPPDDFFIMTYTVPADLKSDEAAAFTPFTVNYNHASKQSILLEKNIGKRTANRIAKTLRNFVASWAAFVTDPDIIVVETCKSSNARAKVVREHGHCPQSMRAIRLTGVLRKYVQEQRSHADEQERRGVKVHWVRGHVRRLTSARYTPEKRGTTVWIPPHVRGTGSGPLKRTYEVSMEKNA